MKVEGRNPKTERTPRRTGARTRETLELLRNYESRNVTFIEPDWSWPIVWARAKGVHVWDAEGRKYLDLTAAFGVAASGHANPRVVRAGQRQMETLLHAMGDVHPHALKARLARELGRITFERWTAKTVRSPQSTVHSPQSTVYSPNTGRFRTPHSALRARDGPRPEVQSPKPKGKTSGDGWGQTGKTIFCNSGFEAVEAALKTALLATGRPGVIAFTGAYHGLGYGALNATHRDHFRAPFRQQLAEFGYFMPFPAARSAGNGHAHDSSAVGQGASLTDVESQIRGLCEARKIGAILVEPIQVRGGINLALPEFLPLLRGVCDEYGAVLILDEIYTGFGRTGAWFACEHFRVTPDVICLGKALTGGFPLSACVGRAELMERAWPPSTGEAIHTSTFLGHPVGCAMALAQLEEIERRQLVRRSAELGKVLLSCLRALETRNHRLRIEARGLGLLAGLELRCADGSPASAESLGIVKALLQRGFIFLPEGEHANVISFTPPLTITRSELETAVGALAEVLA